MLLVSSDKLVERHKGHWLVQAPLIVHGLRLNYDRTERNFNSLNPKRDLADEEIEIH